MSTVSRIMLLLKARAPLTVAQLAEEIGLSEKTIACAIWRARKGGMKIRVCGALRTQNRPFLYEISAKEDAEVDKHSSTPKGRTADDPEEFMDSRKSDPSVKPFRDPFIAAFFGEFKGLSTNTLGEQGYGL